MKYQRNHLTQFKPYTSARDLYKSGLFLDANENYEQWVSIDWSKIANLNRYPDPYCDELRKRLASEYLGNSVEQNNILVSSGSDEIIDLLIRAFVEDDENIMFMNPSYGMYQVQTDIHNRTEVEVLLNEDFSLDINTILEQSDDVKMIFLCSPNNPTGNLITKEELEQILVQFKGIVVVDEAYIEFAGLEKSFASLIKQHNNLVILRTFSKAWGLAGARLGYCVADTSIITVLSKIKEPYNVSVCSQEIGLQALSQIDRLQQKVKKIVSLKQQLEDYFTALDLEIIPTSTNFVLARLPHAALVQKKLAEQGIIVRDRSNLPYLENVLRITVGSESENTVLVDKLQNIL